MTDQEYIDMYHPPRGAIWAAETVVRITDVLGSLAARIHRGAKRFTSFAPVQFISDQFWEPRTLSECETPEQVRAYARSIMRTQPAFANELIAFANKAEGVE